MNVIQTKIEGAFLIEPTYSETIRVGLWNPIPMKIRCLRHSGSFCAGQPFPHSAQRAPSRLHCQTGKAKTEAANVIRAAPLWMIGVELFEKAPFLPKGWIRRRP